MSPTDAPDEQTLEALRRVLAVERAAADKLYDQSVDDSLALRVLERRLDHHQRQARLLQAVLAAYDQSVSDPYAGGGSFAKRRIEKDIAAASGKANH